MALRDVGIWGEEERRVNQSLKDGARVSHPFCFSRFQVSLTAVGPFSSWPISFFSPFARKKSRAKGSANRKCVRGGWNMGNERMVVDTNLAIIR